MSITFIAIIFFMFGAIVGATVGLFVAGVGENNKEHEYYHEGFVDGYTKAVDGYTKAKEEIK